MTNLTPGTSTVVNPDIAENIKHYPRYKVFVHNDDATPMEFVLYVLMTIFSLETTHAQSVMLEAHEQGLAFVSAYTLEQAEFRVDQAHSIARSSKYPLTFSYEKE